MLKIKQFLTIHQNNLNTSVDLNPKIYKSNLKGTEIISIFERKKNIENIDVNPLIYALKGQEDWKIDKRSLVKLREALRKIVKKLSLNDFYLAVVPSTSQLNSIVAKK